jgi:hypothetical protein
MGVAAIQIAIEVGLQAISGICAQKGEHGLNQKYPT